MYTDNDFPLLHPSLLHPSGSGRSVDCVGSGWVQQIVLFCELGRIGSNPNGSERSWVEVLVGWAGSADRVQILCVGIIFLEAKKGSQKCWILDGEILSHLIFIIIVECF